MFLKYFNAKLLYVLGESRSGIILQLKAHIFLSTVHLLHYQQTTDTEVYMTRFPALALLFDHVSKMLLNHSCCSVLSTYF